MPPPPLWRSMSWMALAMFSWVAGSDSSAMTDDPPEKRRTLNRSVGRRFPIRLFRSFFEISSGNPCMDPDTSTMKIYSRPGMSALRDPLRRLHHEEKEVLLFPLEEEQPRLDPVAVEPVAQDIVAVAARGLRGVEGIFATDGPCRPFSPCGTGRQAPGSGAPPQISTVDVEAIGRRLSPGADRGSAPRSRREAPFRPSGWSSGDRRRWDRRTHRHGPSGRCSSVYLISTLISSPGMMLATFIWKTLGRCCSRREALFPWSRACS